MGLDRENAEHPGECEAEIDRLTFRIAELESKLASEATRADDNYELAERVALERDALRREVELLKAGSDNAGAIRLLTVADPETDEPILVTYS